MVFLALEITRTIASAQPVKKVNHSSAFSGEMIGPFNSWITSHSDRNNKHSTLVKDHDIPEMNGLELYKKIRSSFVIKRIIIVGILDYKCGVKELNHKIVDSFVTKYDLSRTINYAS